MGPMKLARKLLKPAAGLAQLVEHIIRNDGVRCSSHLSGTIFPDVKTNALILGRIIGFLPVQQNAPEAVRPERPQVNTTYASFFEKGNDRLDIIGM